VEGDWFFPTFDSVEFWRIRRRDMKERALSAKEIEKERQGENNSITL
jgi:hypothetical protein